MQTIRTRDHSKDKSFSLEKWVGTLGGAALSTDSDPNTSEPVTNRVIRARAKRDGVMVMGTMLLRVVIADGTSLTFRPWMYDNHESKWIPHGNAQTVTFATGNIGNGTVLPGNIAGAKVFVQITANTGCTVMGIDFS